MYRVIKMQSKLFALEIKDIEDDSDNINAFLESGDVVLLAERLDSIADLFDMDESEIELVE